MSLLGLMHLASAAAALYARTASFRRLHRALGAAPEQKWFRNFLQISMLCVCIVTMRERETV
jgi:hypothetical protein